MLIEKVKSTIKKYNLIERGDKVVVAVSGGADSTSLLFALNELKDDYVLKLYIAHFDHMFRGAKEAVKDHDYICALSQRLKLPLIFGKADVPKYAKDAGLSLEEAAREKRYEFLLDTAKEAGALKIALGHTLDDQAETVLMRLIRGAGLGGLRGILPARNLDGRLIIRPLLDVWRKEIDEYLRSLKVEPRQDTTNKMTKFLRNKVRLKLLDILKEYNPNIKEVLVRNAQGLTYDYEVLADLIEKEFKKFARVTDGSVRIAVKDLMRVRTAIEKGILRKAIEKVKGDLRGIDYSHVEGIEELFEEKKGALDLPGKIRAQRAGDSIILCKIEDEKSPAIRMLKKLIVPGRTRISEIGIVFEAKFVKARIGRKKPANTEYMDYDKLKLPLYLRTRREGDRFKPFGMAAEKKLQDFYVDEKVPRIQRSSIPLVVSGKDIIWVCGLRLSDKVKVTPSTRRILKLSFTDLF